MSCFMNQILALQYLNVYTLHIDIEWTYLIHSTKLWFIYRSNVYYNRDNYGDEALCLAELEWWFANKAFTVPMGGGTDGVLYQQ